MQIDISFPFVNLSEVSKDTDKMRGGIYSSFMTVYLKYSCKLCGASAVCKSELYKMLFKLLFC